MPVNQSCFLLIIYILYITPYQWLFLLSKTSTDTIWHLIESVKSFIVSTTNLRNFKCQKNWSSHITYLRVKNAFIRCEYSYSPEGIPKINYQKSMPLQPLHSVKWFYFLKEEREAVKESVGGHAWETPWKASVHCWRFQMGYRLFARVFPFCWQFRVRLPEYCQSSLLRKPQHFSLIRIKLRGVYSVGLGRSTQLFARVLLILLTELRVSDKR